MGRPLSSYGLQVCGAYWMMVVAMLYYSASGQLTSSLPVQIEFCGVGGCTLNNAYTLWNDRSICKAATVRYPTTEPEIIAAVATAVEQKFKIKVITTFGHSIPKLACPDSFGPGVPNGQLLISTKNYTAIVNIDPVKRTVTAQGGILLRTLIDGVAAAGLALPISPGFDGVSLAGLLSTGAHGSSMFNKGANLHEYVIGMRIVTPASKGQGYAMVRVVGAKDEALKAARVSLGVLGVISTVTLQLQPQFKRSVTLTYAAEDAGMEDEILRIARTEEFGDVTWYPSLAKVVYKYDHRVAANAVGEGSNNFIGSQPTPVRQIVQFRKEEEIADASGATGRLIKCELAARTVAQLQGLGYGLYKDGVSFSGFPVIGPQNRIMTAGGCQRIEAGPDYACDWDSLVGGIVFFEDGVALPLQHLKAFFADVKLLRTAVGHLTLCDLDLYTGIYIRFAKKQTAYMGPVQEDMVMVDFAWSRGDDGTSPRLDMDVFQELEQIAIYKYGGRPHWGKNRNYVFDGVRKRYENLPKFVAVKNKFDPKGVFSSEWSDAILGLNHKQAAKYFPHCAIEGNCRCKTDEHCAPEKFSFCRPGRIYAAARVCRTEAPAPAPTPPAP